MGPFLLIVFDLANLGKAIFYILLFLALVSINPRQADSSVSNYTGPEDDWTATILAFLSKGKSNLFYGNVNVKMPFIIIDYFFRLLILQLLRD